MCLIWYIKMTWNTHIVICLCWIWLRVSLCLSLVCAGFEWVSDDILIAKFPSYLFQKWVLDDIMFGFCGFNSYYSVSCLSFAFLSLCVLSIFAGVHIFDNNVGHCGSASQFCKILSASQESFIITRQYCSHISSLW